MDDLRYGIAIEGKIIAKFMCETDRDYCIDELAVHYEDCEFDAVEDE